MAEEIAVQHRRLISTRGAHRGQMTKLINKADELVPTLENATREQIQPLVGIVDSIISKADFLKQLDQRIVDETSEEQLVTAIIESDDYITSINSKITMYKYHLETTQTRTSLNNSITTNTSTTQKRKVNLPKLLLPKFDGNMLKWVGFIDAFTASVDNDSNLEDVNKFQYLAAHLTGEAARVVEGLSLSSANYKEALELLNKRYGQPHTIISSYMKALWDLPKPSNDVRSIRSFYDDLETYIRGLRSLGKTEDSYGDLLVPIVFEKLPGIIRKQISRDHGEKAWSLKELRDAIYREVRASQAGTEEADDANIMSTAATFHVGLRGKMNLLCAFCKGSHANNTCSVVTDHQKRLEIVKRERLCYNCLNKHRVHDCTSKNRCKKCKRKHHTSICDSDNRSEVRNPESAVGKRQAETGVYLTPTSGPILLKTAVGQIASGTGSINVNILLDEGAQRSFITQDVARRLKIDLTTCDTESINFSSFGANTSGMQLLKRQLIQLETNKGVIDITALIVPTISTPVKNYVTRTVLQYPYLQNLSLAPHVRSDEFEIDLLVGADHYWSLVEDNVVRGPGPTAVASKLGYLLSGPSNLQNVSVMNTMILKVITQTDTDKIDLAKFWDLETIGIRSDVTENTDNNNMMTFDRYKKDYLRMEGNQYVAKLPWKPDHPALPTNLHITEKRTRAMVRRLAPEIRDKYAAIINEQESRGFVERVNEDNRSHGHYLPHRAVIKYSSTSTPVRVVYDCSCREYKKSTSLNDCLDSGPRLLNDLGAILLRFRLHNIGLVSDIEKAFLHISLDEEDRDYTKFLWISDPNNAESEFVTYRFKSILFGAACSPFILNAVVKLHLENLDTLVTTDMKTNIYVDNVISGTNTVDNAMTYFNESNKAMKSGGFVLRSWSSNCKEIRDRAEIEKIADSNAEVNILGMRWDTDLDQISYPKTVRVTQEVVSKREVVRHTSNLYDPLGYLSPVQVKAKIFIQELWSMNLGWDDQLNSDLTRKWITIRDDINTAREISLNRQYFDKCHKINADYELHAFGDASCKAYGAVVYLRGQKDTSIIIAKNRVAPLKSLTLPRLELLAAFLASKLLKYVSESFGGYNMQITKSVLWSDSQIVLHWLNSTKNLPIFVSNRVNQIKAVPCVYKYCPTDDNPADLLTRGISTCELRDSDFWWHGPSWLTDDNNWPECDLFDCSDVELSVNESPHDLTSVLKVETKLKPRH